MASWLVISTLDEIMTNSLKFCSLELDAKSLLTPSQTRLISRLLVGPGNPRNEIFLSHFLLIVLCVARNQAKILLKVLVNLPMLNNSNMPTRYLNIRPVYYYFTSVCHFIWVFPSLDCKLHKSREWRYLYLYVYSYHPLALRPPHWAPGPVLGASQSITHLIFIIYYGRYCYYYFTKFTMC